jgi:pimeloyl-ACP methyl ester carboxylesterase
MPAKIPLPKPLFVNTNGIRMAVYEDGEGFPIVFCHGYPELAYSWRSQISALSLAGFHAIAPDQRGYGLTEIPESVDAYTIQQLCADLVGLLNYFRIKRAVFCGHDWGGAVVWMMPKLYPDRVAGVIGINTPYMPRAPLPTTQLLEQVYSKDHYIVEFQRSDYSDKLMAKDVRKSFKFMYGKKLWDIEGFQKEPADSPWRNLELNKLLEAYDESDDELLVPEEQLDFFMETFEKTGFTGGINWYRNVDKNWETTADLDDKINVPCLYVGADNDVVLQPSMMDNAEQWIPDLEKQTITDCSHWTQQQKPEELNKIIVDWMQRKFGNWKGVLNIPRQSE